MAFIVNYILFWFIEGACQNTAQLVKTYSHTYTKMFHKIIIIYSTQEQDFAGQPWLCVCIGVCVCPWVMSMKCCVINYYHPPRFIGKSQWDKAITSCILFCHYFCIPHSVATVSPFIQPVIGDSLLILFNYPNTIWFSRHPTPGVVNLSVNGLTNKNNHSFEFLFRCWENLWNSWLR